MKQIKILYVFPTMMQSNGIVTLFFNYLERFNPEEFEISIIAGDNEPSEAYIKYMKEKGYKFYLCPKIKSKNLFKIRRFFAKFFKENHDFNIVHSNNNILGYFASKFAKKYNINVRIIHSHSTIHATNKIKSMIIEWFSKRAIKLSTNYFACSIKAGEFMFKDKEFFEMNNAIIVERYKDLKANKDVNKEKFGFKKDDFIIGFIGRLESQKNVLFLPHVLKALKVSKPNAKLVIVGSGSDLESLKEEAKSLDLVNDVVILEALPGIFEILPTFDCFIMSSIFEGLPMVAVEAQTALIPCVLSKNITEETKFTNAVKFVSLEDDYSKWANAILEVTNMNNCYNDKDKFNIDVQAKILIEKYKELIEINKNS